MSRTLSVSNEALLVCNTDIGRTEVVRVALENEDRGKEEYPKVIGTSVIRLPKFTKGLGRIVKPVKQPARIKGKGKEAELSGLLDATGEGKAVRQPEPPDAKGKWKAVAQSEPPDAKGTGKAVTPPCPLDSKSKDKAVQTSDSERKDLSAELLELPHNESKGKGKSVQPPGLTENIVKGNTAQTPGDKSKGNAAEPSGPPDNTRIGKAALQREPQDDKGKGKAPEEYESMQGMIIRLYG